MHHNYKWFHLTKNLKSSLLFDEKDNLLTRHMRVKDINELHGMISLQEIDNHNCFFRSGLQLLRVHLMIILIIMLFFNFIPYFIDFKEDWNRCDLHIIKYVDNANDEEYLSELKRYVGDDKKMSLKEYLYYRYNEYAYSEEYLVSDILRACP